MTEDTGAEKAFESAVGHHQAGRLAEAEKSYRGILEVEPGHAGALHLLGMIGHQTGNPDLAVKLIAEAVAIAPDYAEAHNNLGNALKDLGRLDEAVACYRRAITIVPDYAKAHNNLGGALADRGEIGDAIAGYRKAIELAPDFAMPHYNLGNALRDTDRPEQAAACYRRAIEIVPTFTEAHHNLGEAIKAGGKMDEAIDCFRQALRINPDYAPANFSLAVALQDQGRMAEAIVWFKRAVENEPAHLIAHFWLSAALNSMGRQTRARRVLEKGVRQQPIRTTKCTAKGNAPATVLKLVGLSSARVLFDDGTPWVRGGNLDTTVLLDKQKFMVHEFFIHEDNLLSAATELPPFDIVLNGIVEPDLEAAALNTAQAFIGREGALCINEPHKIFSTSRDRMSELLAGIDNLVVPKVVRETLAANDPSLFMPVVEKHGLGFPLIVRPIGGHIGAGMTKVDREDDFERVRFATNIPMFYFTEFHEYNDDKGFYCKHRSYFLGGTHHSSHAVISNHWNVHVDHGLDFMKHHDWMKSVDENFLRDGVDYLGQNNFDAMKEIDRRVGLDFFGIDYSILPDGRLLLFECNPAMRYLGFAFSLAEQFAYREKYALQLRDAFSEFVLARIRR